MKKSSPWPLFLLRLSMGWMFLYAGLTKVLNPEWSAAGYLQGAKNFIPFHQWLASPEILPITNALNEWGLTLLGASLILGLFVRLSSILGAILMLLYYVPILDFPYPNEHAYLVDEHIIYAFALLYLGQIHAGRIIGLETYCAKLPLCKKFPKLRSWLG